MTRFKRTMVLALLMASSRVWAAASHPEVLFSGVFGKGPHKMAFTIQRLSGRHARIQAQIRPFGGRRGSATAICPAQVLGEGRELRMQCRMVGLSSIHAPATLFLTPGAAPRLQFGSWLEGYTDTTLRVGLDRLTPRPLRQLARAD